MQVPATHKDRSRKMVKALSGPYRIDRIDPPQFYTPKTADNPHRIAPGRVLAPSNDNPNPQMVTLGFVSAQTPFGQGTSLVFYPRTLRIATPDEVRATLKRDHPHGTKFRPICGEAINTGSHTTVAARDAALAQYMEIMSRWDAVTARQIAAVLRQIG